jgi:hypothetical protein
MPAALSKDLGGAQAAKGKRMSEEIDEASLLGAFGAVEVPRKKKSRAGSRASSREPAPDVNVESSVTDLACAPCGSGGAEQIIIKIHKDGRA